MVVSWVERVEEFFSRERAAALDGSDAGIYESASRTDESVGPVTSSIRALLSLVRSAVSRSR